MYAMNEWHNAYLLALVGLVILALIDDKSSLIGHQIGVVVMAVGAFYAILSFDNLRTRLSLLLCAALLFCGRVAMKIIAVVLFEGLYSFSQVKDKCIEIGYNGVTRHPQFLIPVFQVCGVMQWLVFYLILTAI
jgi:steroid 5-alpha reductase family enzyme